MGATNKEAAKDDGQNVKAMVRQLEGTLTIPSVAESMRKVMTDYLPPERLTRLLLTEASKPDKNGKYALLECANRNPTSFLRAAMACSQLGLEPGPMQLVYLIPYGAEVQFIVGYKGYVNLACRSGIDDVDAATVHEFDAFDWARGTDPFIKHKPVLGDRGALIGSYAIAWRNGRPRFDVLDMDDITRARKCSKVGTSGPWIEHTGEMAKKTAIRRLSKLLNLAPNTPLAKANALDDDAIEATINEPPRKAPPSLREALSIDPPAAKADDDVPDWSGNDAA